MGVSDEEMDQILNPKLNYVGIWEAGGYHCPDGTLFTWGQIWGLCSRHNILNMLANVTDDSGRSVIVLAGTKLDRVLEIGCDYGHDWSALEPYFNEVHGIEISDHALLGQQAGRKIVHGSMDDMSCFEDSFFDVVISGQVLEHSPDINTTLNEIYRITKPGGWSVHMMPCTPDDIVKEAPSEFHPTILTYSGWVSAFSLHGFIVARDFFMWGFNQESWVIVVRKFG